MSKPGKPVLSYVFPAAFLAAAFLFFFGGCSPGNGNLSASDLAERLSKALKFEDGSEEDGAPPDPSDGSDMAAVLAVDLPSKIYGGQGFIIVIEVDAPSEDAARYARIGIDGYGERHYKTEAHMARWDPEQGRGTVVITANLLRDEKLYGQTFRLKAGLETLDGKVGRYKDFALNITGPCVSEDEVCDRLDNDCDLSVDEDFVDRFTECTLGDVSTGCQVRGLMDCSDDGTKLECKADLSAKNGRECNDGLWCTVGETCQNGQCTAGADRDCTAEDDDCNLGTCDEDTDSCVKKPKAGEATCDDGLWCTINDKCENGECKGQARDCSGSGDDCHPGACDDGNDTCVPGAAYADDSPCGNGGVCLGGICGTHECPEADTDLCSDDGTTLEHCAADAMGFRKKSTKEICSGETPFCHPTLLACVACVHNSDCNEGAGEICLQGKCGTHECPKVDDTRCNPAGDAIETCTTNTDGFRVWTQTETCTGGTPACDPSGPTCVECTSDDHCAIRAGGDTCENKACVCGAGGNECSGDTPACRESDHTCVECVAASDCSGFEVCGASNACGPLFPESRDYILWPADFEALAVEDVNMDGEPDVLAISIDSGLGVWFNNGGRLLNSAPTVYKVDPGGQMNQPTEMVTGDFNGDSAPDLAISDYGAPTFAAILMNDGTGKFSTSLKIDMNNDSFQRYEMGTGDLDSDNDIDLAVFDRCTDTGPTTRGVRVFLNDGDGTSFTEGGCYGDLGQALAMTTVDYDSDGDLDLALLNSTDYNVKFLENNGSAVFTVHESIPFDTADDMYVHDLNGDKLPDFVVTSWFHDNFTVCLNKDRINGDVAFDCTAYDVAPFKNPVAPVALDMDGDNDMDLAVPCSYGDGLLLFENNGLGGFTYVQTYVTGFRPRVVAQGNLDSDTLDIADLIVGCSSTDNSKLIHLRMFTGRSDGTFNGPAGTAEGGSAGYIDVADLDQDGDADVVYSERSNDKIVAFINQNGRLAMGFETTVGDEPTRLKLADLDGDNYPDAVVPNFNDNTISVCINSAGKMFSSCQAFQMPVNSKPKFVAIGDLTGDDKPDVAAVSSGKVVVWQNDGTGVLSKKSEIDSGDTDTVAIGDIDGDKLNDLVVLRDGSSDYLDTFINPGGGDFDQATPVSQRIAVTSVDPSDLVLKDTDNDGDLDVVITTYSGDELWVFKNDGSGVYDPGSPVKYQLGSLGCSNPYRMAMADFDNDKDLDLAVLCAESDKVALLRQDASRLTVFPYLVDSGAGPVSIGIGKFDGNESPDIAVGGYDGKNISIILNNMGR
ncbi:MAG: VCBS repeat-containing protein [Deltaproteobacteria bacterium]|nr:VCBS repeat-containing protein [Deltaproteobacteria bacterium]